MGNIIQDIQSIRDTTYNNYSIGDKVISDSAANNKYSSGNIINDILEIRKNKVIDNTPEIVGTTNVIPVDRNDDDSVKVTFDNIYENNN